MQTVRARGREHLYLLSFSSCCLWGPEDEIKTGNRGDERRKRAWSRVPRWTEVWMAENRQEMAWDAQGPPTTSKTARVVSLSQCFYVSLARALSFSFSAQVSSKLEIFKN